MRAIEGVEYRKLDLHPDARGRFVEIVRAADHPHAYLQSNHSRSKAGALRGLHYHLHQADLWYVVVGRIQVGLVDLRVRSDSPLSTTVILEEDDPATLFIPPGVAHGFLALTDVDLIYWVTQEYDAQDEFGIAWDDPALGLEWEIKDPIISDRDANNPGLRWEQIPAF